MAESTKPRTWFAPMVATGLATAGLMAVTSARAWFRLDLPQPARVGVTDAELHADMPLALALSLVVLASWGAVLVSRGRARRIELGVAVLANLGVLACAARAPFSLPDQIRAQVLDGDGMTANWTYAYVIAALAAVLSLVTVVSGLRLAPRWPTMSTRYDAPTTSVAETETDLWKALDAGRDPTDPRAASGP